MSPVLFASPLVFSPASAALFSYSATTCWKFRGHHILIMTLDVLRVTVDTVLTTTGSSAMSPTDPTSDELIRLDWGWPSLELNPIAGFQASSLSFFAEADKVQSALHYGSFAGSDEVRETYAKFFSHQRAEALEAEQIFITSGAGAAMGLLCDIHAERGQSVLTQGATYQNALKIFASRQLHVEPIAELPGGDMDLTALDALLSRERERFALIYLIPTFANPTGRTLDIDTRRALVTLAQRHEILIIADEVYHPLHFSDDVPPPPVLSHFDETGRFVVSLGSFTKIGAPGLRLGWAETGKSPDDHRDSGNLITQLSQHGTVQNGGCLNHMTSMLVAEFIRTGGLSHHLSNLRRTYRERSRVLHKALTERLSPEFISVKEVSGGYYLWLEPSEVLTGSMTALAEAAERHGIRYRAGNQFVPPHHPDETVVSHGIRLCFAFYPPRELQLGAARLTRAIIETVSGERA